MTNRGYKMFLRRGLEDFPEAIGMEVYCAKCKGWHSSDDTISISKCQPNRHGGIQMVQYLACFTCTTKTTEAQGQC